LFTMVRRAFRSSFSSISFNIDGGIISFRGGFVDMD